jgi:glycosyltransferase involved in cell wall biosynthesis
LFIYGGNLGKPQGLDFLTDVLGSNNKKPDRFFIIIGSGTAKLKLAKWFLSHQITNAILLDSLPKLTYDQMLASCDVGLIFLDKRFTIPNYPSRLLSYLENKMPILIASDTSTDVGTIAEENGYGLWAEHGDISKFNQHLEKLCGDDTLRRQMGENGYRFLIKNYTVENSYKIIMKHFEDLNI